MIYIVREISHSDNPADKGMELRRFRSYDEASAYSDALYLEDGIKSYVSEEAE
jgi:hypothetical protein